MQRHSDSGHDVPAEADAPPASSLRCLIAAVAIAAACPLVRRPRAVAAALRPYLGRADLLHDRPCPCAPDRYVRHLLHAGSDHTILALVWRPGQMSPVHGHRSWCALGIHSGSMTELAFANGHHGPAPLACAQRGTGATSHAAADPARIHRLANLGTETAISIHVYGVRHDRLGQDVNHVWAA
jgi:predicted metal-dependent enzyme (double-stranded beta helix superfamily)